MAIIPNEVGRNIVIDTPQKQKSRKLFIIFVAVVIFTGMVIYFGFGNGGSSDGQPSTAGQPAGGETPAASIATQQQIDQGNNILESLKNVSLNNAVFTDKKFQSLILSEQLPVVVGTKGRENSFAPF